MVDSGNKAAKAGLAYTVGNVLLKGVTFLTLPIFSRILTTEEFGFYNLGVEDDLAFFVFLFFRAKALEHGIDLFRGYIFK